MTHPEDSLAERAAAWVPPWRRETVAPQPEPDDEIPAAPAEVPVEQPRAESEPTAEPEPTADPEAEPPAESETSAELEPPVVSAAEPLAETAGTVSALAVPPSDLDPADLRSALEAILLVVDEPVSELVLAQVLDQPSERVFDALVTLAESYTQQRRGFELRRAAGGWRLYTREAYAGYVERFILDGQSVRLTQAALETLAVVAYKQPVTRSRISAIRGVNCDGVVRTLVSRGLIEECGAEPDSGAHLYRTTSLFLEKLGLDGLDELPPLAPFLPDDVEELSDATP